MFSENPQTKINSLQGLLNAERKASAGLKASVESLTSQLMEKEVAHRENIREISRMAHEKEDVVFKLVSDRFDALSGLLRPHASPVKETFLKPPQSQHPFLLPASSSCFPCLLLCGSECIWQSVLVHHLDGQGILV